MKIALVHDYLSQDGGAERVLRALHEIYPQAPIFVLFHDPNKINYLDTEKIKTSFLNHLPFVNQIFQWYLPLMPLATERHQLQGYDLVISSSSGFAKGVITSPSTLHIAYCHTPPRFLWGDGNNYLSDLKNNRLVKILLAVLTHRLRQWDQLSTQRVDHFIANSNTVRRRINKYYRRDSQIIFPPVDVDRFKIENRSGNYYVAGGRLVPYKRLDLVVKVFNRLGWALKIFGTGSEFQRLKKLAKTNIEFYGKISEEEKAQLLSQATAFIHPQKEDFGITPLEAMAAGVPVIAFSEGGATETVINHETGVFFEKQTWESLLHTILNFQPNNFNSAKIRAHAQNFSAERFKADIQKFVNDKYGEFQNQL
jgi:glycosyltransferase involved in cell wall biosynthesis